jgi:TetR/AcrR family transcriptional regulator, lmrAB and yxaGH operons repressor
MIMQIIIVKPSLGVLDGARGVPQHARAVGRPKKSAAKPRSEREARGRHEEPLATRERMIEGAAQLLSRRGLQGTSFSEVLAHTGSPRGSLYHHFPGGKDEMIRAALDRVSAMMAGVMERKAGARAEEITELFLRVWRGVLAGSELEAGCAVLAVTVAAESPELLDHAGGIFRAWRGRLAELLERGGLARDDAARFAATLIAASEGAVVLSRGERSMEPFELVAAELLAQVRRMGR